ncbi:hypothetical protein [Geodermatophilus sp. URMC 64]
MTGVDVVEAVYDAFGRADVQRIMELFAPDCVSPPVPRAAVRNGRIARFEVYLDTAGMLAALGSPPA